MSDDKPKRDKLVVAINAERRKRYEAAAAADVRVLSDWVRLQLDRAVAAAEAEKTA